MDTRGIDQMLSELRATSQVAAGKPVIGGGAGTGITAKSAEAGGIDLIVSGKDVFYFSERINISDEVVERAAIRPELASMAS